MCIHHLIQKKTKKSKATITQATHIQTNVDVIREMTEDRKVLISDQ